MGLSLDNIAKSITDVLLPAVSPIRTSGWITKNAYTYQTQVQVPEYIMNSVEQLNSVSAGKRTDAPCLVGYCNHFD